MSADHRLQVYENQGREFDLLIFRSLKKIYRDQITLVDLWKRYKRANRSCRSLKKSKRANRFCRYLKNKTIFTWDSRKSLSKNICLVCFWQFSPLFMPKEQIAPVDLRSFLKIDGIDLLSLIFEKDRPWANPSRGYLKKNGRSVPVFFTIKSIFQSIDHKKRAIRSKISWSNAQPWRDYQKYKEGKLI